MAASRECTLKLEDDSELLPQVSEPDVLFLLLFTLTKFFNSSWRVLPEYSEKSGGLGSILISWVVQRVFATSLILFN